MRYWIAVCVAAVCVVSGMETMGAIDGKKLTIGNPQGGYGTTAPYFFATLDAAGFSDWIWYGPSPEHDVGKYHEILSGEWGAAIWYDGIDTNLIDESDPNMGSKAMWLTQLFEYPDWPTNSTFNVSGDCAASSDPNNNPAPLMDKGLSVISNGIVEITIDYEVVDLEFLDPNYYPVRSIMGYLDRDTGNPAVMESDRYCFLQTYTIRNINPNENPVNDIEFYQLLHSHGADEYGPAVNSTYTNISIEDPLEYYTPYDAVHEVGDFRYDITQWNSTYGPASTQGHTDFVTFSCVHEPNWVDNDLYEGHDGKPGKGTHINIENRLLNEEVSIYYNEVCGAMGWYLGSLDADETVSLTVAFMFGKEQEEGESLSELTKSSDIDPNDSVSPGDEITYTVCWENTSDVTAEDVLLVDYLPAGVWYEAGWNRLDPNWLLIPADPNYDQAKHTYTWDLGDVAPDESGCVTLTVEVDDRSEPGMPMTNEVRFKSTNLGVAEADDETKVCCWGGDVIYVDPQATGYDNGISWVHAYTDLQRALTRAAAGCGTEIWVAQGKYSPGREADSTFAIADGVEMYGGFKGDETSVSEGNPDRYKTILTGKVNDTANNETVVTMGNNTVLDGFTVMEGELQGVYVEDAVCVIENCTIKQNHEYGILSDGSDLTVRWSAVISNGFDGVSHEGSGCTLVIENSYISANATYGVYTLDSTPTILNSVIARNGFYEVGSPGVRVVNPSGSATMYNCTLAYNKKEGLSWLDDVGSGNDPNVLDYPDIQNCIVWYNNGGGDQLHGYEFTQYSCVYDPNDSDGTDYTLDAFGNFSGNPGFAYEYSSDPNVVLNVHLAYDSQCIDKGSDSLSYTGQSDIDAEDRVVGNYVDIGADEVYSCDDDLTEDDIYNPVDWTADGIVNMYEYGIFARAWLSVDPNNPLCDPNNPNYVSDPNDPDYISEGDKLRYSSRCDIDEDLDVDMADLDLFSDEWLWMACWKESILFRFDMMAMGGFEASSMMMEGSAYLSSAPYSETTPQETGVSSFVLGIYGVLSCVEAEIQQEPENLESLYDLKGFLVECLEEVKATIRY